MLSYWNHGQGLITPVSLRALAKRQRTFKNSVADADLIGGVVGMKKKKNRKKKISTIRPANHFAFFYKDIDIITKKKISSRIELIIIYLKTNFGSPNSSCKKVSSNRI